MKQRLDVVILGGGPAGASAGISLLQKNYSVAIIEKSDYSASRIGETVQPQLSILLSDLKITNTIFQQHLPSNTIESVWGDASLKENNFIRNPFGHGWHLDRLQFDKQLIDHAEKAGATLFKGSEVKTITQSDAGNWCIRFLNRGSMQTIHTRFIVDATGRNSFLVKHQGGFRKNIDHLIGLVSVRHTNSVAKESNFTLLESVKNGWWYSADIPGNKVVMAFMTDADIYKKEKTNAERYYDQSLSIAKFTEQRCSRLIPTPINVYAANSYVMSKTHGRNWLAIGDAEMAYDPLSSQGIYKAIKSGTSAATAVHEQFIGNKFALENYANTGNIAFERYMQQRRSYYLMEKRWPQSLFWKRRHTDI